MELDEVSVTLFSRMDRVFLDDERDLPTVVIHDYRVTALHNSDRDQLCVGNHTIKARRWRRQSVGIDDAQACLALAISRHGPTTQPRASIPAQESAAAPSALRGTGTAPPARPPGPPGRSPSAPKRHATPAGGATPKSFEFRTRRHALCRPRQRARRSGPPPTLSLRLGPAGQHVGRVNLRAALRLRRRTSRRGCCRGFSRGLGGVMRSAQALQVVEVVRVTAETGRHDLVHGVRVVLTTRRNALVVVAVQRSLSYLAPFPAGCHSARCCATSTVPAVCRSRLCVVVHHQRSPWCSTASSRSRCRREPAQREQQPARSTALVRTASPQRSQNRQPAGGVALIVGSGFSAAMLGASWWSAPAPRWGPVSGGAARYAQVPLWLLGPAHGAPR